MPKRKYTIEDLYLIADYPVEVVREFILPLYAPYNDEAKRSGLHNNSEYAGVNKFTDYYHIPEKPTREILKLERNKVSIEYCDKLTLNLTCPFNLNDLTEASIEWAEKNDSAWPVGYEPRQKYRKVKK